VLRRRRSALAAAVVVSLCWTVVAGAAATHNGKIAYLHATQCGGSDCSDLWIMNADGSDRFRLTQKGRSNLSGNTTAPVWSPNGRQLAYFAEGRCAGAPCMEIFLANADGSNQHQLTSNVSQLYPYSPSWSPSGKSIAFTGVLHNSNSTLDDNACLCVFAIDTTGRNLRILARHAFDPAWSPNGSKIAYGVGDPLDGAIFTMNPNGSGKHNLSTDTSSDTWPVWSPDGSKLAFQGVPHANMNLAGGHVMNADGSGRKQISKNGALGAPLGWSPDGKKVLLGSSGGAPIIVANADGSGAKTIRRLAGAAAWSPDGKKIAYINEDNGKDEIYLMNPDGSGQHRLTAQYQSDIALAWQPVRS
jgi:Tol biopolymer transport system component